MADPEEADFQDGTPEIVPSYQYEPLPTLEHTRVLVLEPGPNDDNELPLVASLRLHDLRDTDSEPFEAISYTWGSSEKTHVILVDGLPLPITASLRSALLQARPFDQPRRLWADAICIDQSDKNEKGHQVAAMGRIYKASKRTLICLGFEYPDSAQHAAGLVDEVNLMIQNIRKDPDFSSKPGSFPFPAENETILSDFRWELGWDVMLAQPWFRRGWVVQEASLGPDACVLWASVQIGWTSVLRVSCWLDHRGSPVQFQDGSRPDGLVGHHYCSFARRHPEEINLFDENSKYAFFESTLPTLFNARVLGLADERDRIYAFMALDTSDGILADLKLEPDYERSFEKIYHDFAVKYIEKTGDLDILSFLKHNKESLARSITAEAIPSWVPRWDLEPNWRGAIRTEMGDYPKIFEIIQKDSVLQVCGLILGSVEYCAAQEPYCEYDQRSLALQNMTSLWNEVVAASSINEGPYNGRQAFAFFDVLCPFHEIGTREQWITWRQEFAWHLQSLIAGPERNSATSISRQNELRTEQHSLKTLAEEIRSEGRRRFVILSRGYYGVAPQITQEGDLFALIYGSKTLSILRPAEDKPGHYRILGPVYVESKTVKRGHESNMMGEAGCRDWEEWGLTEQDISLC